MNTYLFASVENMWLVAGWTMIHFLWLGALVGLIALCCRWLFRRTSATTRYAVSITWLILVAALPIAIATWLATISPPLKGGAGGGTASSSDPPTDVVTSKANVSPQTRDLIDLRDQPANLESTTATVVDGSISVGSDSAAVEPSPSPSLSGRGIPLVGLTEACIPYLPWLWLIGSPITFAVTATGLIGTRRLRRASRPITDGPIAEALVRLAASLHLTRRVAVAVCDRIAAPVLIGILRPIILLPPAALTGYSPDEIEMVLLHELAHVRRWDNLVNFIQRLIESILFFHPAIWLISSWVRRERESCCDALVVTRTDRPHAYAELLVALAAQMPRSVLFHPAASSAMAAGPLRSRIRRILKLDDDPMLISGKSFALMLASLLAAATLAVLYLPSIGQAEQSKPETNENADATTPGKRKLEADKSGNPREEVSNKEGNAKEQVRTPGTRDVLKRSLQDLQREIKHKYDEYIDAALGRDRIQSPRDPGIDLLLRDIVDTQSKVEDLTTGYFRLQSDYVIAKRELSDPALLEAQADAAIKQDPQFNELQKQLRNAREVPSDSNAVADSLNQRIEQYRAEFTKKAVREMQSNPNASLQQLTQRFKTQADSMQKQIAVVTQNLEQKKKQLEKRVEKSAELETRGEELKRLQQTANEISVKLEGLDTEAEAPEPMSFELKSDGTGQTTIFLNGSHITEDSIRKLLRERTVLTNQSISLKADKSISYADVMKVIDLLESLGIKKLALDTRSSDAKRTATSAADAGAKTLATFPLDWQGNGEYLKQLEEAFRTNLHIDVVRRGDHILVIGRPQPSEKDWATILGEPPRKERVIAERAWQRLGLKLVPLTQIEYYYRQNNGKPVGLLIVGGNVPKGLPAASILTKVNGTAIEDIDQLFAWLNTEAGSVDDSVVCNAVADDKQYLFDAAPPTTTNPAAETDVLGLQPSAPAANIKSPYKFPTLDEQKLADLAWKRLQLELEPLGKDDLKWVQAHGYDGGVKVAAVGGDKNTQQYDIKATDILVRLNVWPTTSMKDVAQILARDELADLNPLKFYVVRTEYNVDASPIVTGRIMVKLPESGFGTGGQFPSRSDYFYKSTSQSPAPISVERAEMILKDATEKRDAALKAKQEALTKRRESATANDDATAEATKRELEQTDRRLEQAKREFENAKRELEQAQKQKPAGKLESQLPTPSAAPKPQSTSSPALSPIVDSRPVQLATSELELQPNTFVGTLVVPNGEQVKVAELRGAPPAAKSGAQRPTDSNPTALFAEPNRRDVKPPDIVFVAYDIPADLKDKALSYFTKSGVRTMADDRGRYIVQASQAWHDNFTALLKAAPKWLDPAAVKQRAAAPVVMNKIDDEDILEWRSVGLSFKSNKATRSYSPVNRTGTAVAGVAPGSPAAWADIRPEDILTEVGSFSAGTMPDVQALLKALGDGLQSKKKVQLTFNRQTSNGTYFVTANLTLGPEDLGGKPADNKGSAAHEPEKQKKNGATSPSTSSSKQKTSQLEYYDFTQSPTTARPPAKPDLLRYNGKTFDEWCQTWQTELSTEKRTEAVKAIAAFGANGFGPEAAATLMELAGQYDWKSIGDKLAIVPLQIACVNAFGAERPSANNVGAVAQSIPVKDALAEFSADIKSANRNQKLFLTYVLPVIVDPQSVELRLILSKDDDPLVRSYALASLPSASATATNDKVVARVREALHSKDGDEVLAALGRLIPSGDDRIALPPEFTSTLLSPNPSARKLARKVATYAKGDEANRVANDFLAILSDESRKDQHIEAIRALAVLKPSEKTVVEKLQSLARSDDQPLSIAAVHALRCILSPTDYNKMLVDMFGERLGIDLANRGASLSLSNDPQKFQEYHALDPALAEERKQIFP